MSGQADFSWATTEDQITTGNMEKLPTETSQQYLSRLLTLEGVSDARIQAATALVTSEQVSNTAPGIRFSSWFTGWDTARKARGHAAWNTGRFSSWFTGWDTARNATGHAAWNTGRFSSWFTAWNTGTWRYFELDPQEQLSRSSNIWNVKNLDVSGLTKRESVVTYVRPASNALWDKLNSIITSDSDSGSDSDGKIRQFRPLMLLDGPPGVGKSTEVYGWASWLSKTRADQAAVWIHNTLTGICVVDFKHEKQCIVKTIGELKNVVDGLVKATVFVVDGFRSTGFKDVVSHLLASKKTIVGCTSFSTSGCFNGQESEEISNFHLFKITTHTMPSWTFEEYSEAFENNVFAGANILSIDVLRTRYFYAGGSIRFMLTENVDDVRRILDASLAKVTDYGIVLKGLSGDSHETSVNTLMQWFEGHSIPLSNYVTRKMVDKATLDFISEAKRLMPNNGSFQGWLFELEVITLLKQGKMEFGGNGNLQWKQGKKDAEFVYFDDPRDIKIDSMKKPHWFISNRYTFGCIDMLYVPEKGKAMPVQVTCAKTHEYKLHIIEPMLLRCVLHKKCSVDFVIIIPKRNLDTFELTDDHFKSAIRISKFDNRWNPKSSGKAVPVQIVSVGGATAVLTDLANDVKFKMAQMHLDTRSSSNAKKRNRASLGYVEEKKRKLKNV